MTLEEFYEFSRDVDFFVKIVDVFIAFTYYASLEDDWELYKTRNIEKITCDFKNKQLGIKVEEE